MQSPSLLISLAVSSLLACCTNAATIEVLGQQKPLEGARIWVAEARPQGEEVIVAKGATGKDGKFTFNDTAGIYYNWYAVADGYRVEASKDRKMPAALRLTMVPLAANNTVAVGEKGVGISLLSDLSEDLIPVRANQGSPPNSWILQIGRVGTLLDNGTKMTTGEFWVKNGDTFSARRDGWKVSCKFVGSIAREVIFLECKKSRDK